MAFIHDEYNQYFISIENQLYMECTNVATALFLLVASHYIFNLTYHPKVHEVLRFLQEKVAGIPSDERSKKIKYHVAVSHMNGISSVYAEMKDNDDETIEVPDESSDN